MEEEEKRSDLLHQNQQQQSQQQLSVLQRQYSNQMNESSGYQSGLDDALSSSLKDDDGGSNLALSASGGVQLYRAMYDYQASHDDELSLQRGAEIRVLSKRSCDEGWWLGVSTVDGRKGIFPSNYVEPATSANSNAAANKTLTNNAGNAAAASSSLVNGEQNLAEFFGPNMPPQIPYTSLEFRDCIGAGGFGKVFRSIWRRPDNEEGELVAIKEARIEGDKDDLIASIKQSVLQEAKLFWQLRHPNIIELKGICLQDPHFCLVMEYAKGGSLGRLLSVRKIGFPPFILIKWALQVSQGMFYLHEQALLLPSRTPIIHRDLKSSNILLSEDVGPLVGVGGAAAEHHLAEVQLKLTDFGLARELQKTTNVMNAAGTYSHMPPEVIKSSTYSKASDVWSFGVLLWELLTGEVPYKGIDPLAIAYGVAVNKLKLPIPSSCPHILSELIHGCWHSDPHMRLTFPQIIERLLEIENSPFATTPNDTFWVMQQDWKSEIEEMFGEIRERESELRSREEELERVSMRQQAYENMLRQRERELEEREKDLVVRELSVALQQQLGIVQPPPPQPPPEPKKRRKVGGRLLTNFLRSSSSNSNTHNALSNGGTGTPHNGSSSNLQATASALVNQQHRSFDISSPSDFQHCFSIQPEILASLKASTPTDEKKLLDPTGSDRQSPQQILANGGTGSGSNSAIGASNLTSSAANILLSPVASPSLRLKIMLPSGDKRSIGLVHQKTLSPYSSRERIPYSAMKAKSIDNTDVIAIDPVINSTLIQATQQQQQQQQSQSKPYYQHIYAQSPSHHYHHQLSASNTPRLLHKHDNNQHYHPHQHQYHLQQQQQQHSGGRVKYQKSNSIWYANSEEESGKRSCSADVSQHMHILATPSGPAAAAAAAHYLQQHLMSGDTSAQVQAANAAQQHAQSSSGGGSSGHGKKLTRILYEIGSILSFVGLGKDYKQGQQHQAAHQKKLSAPTSNLTRRSQEKKYTPSTSTSNIHQINAPLPTTTTTTSEQTDNKQLAASTPSSTKHQSTSPSRITMSTGNNSSSQLLLSATNHDSTTPTTASPGSSSPSRGLSQEANNHHSQSLTRQQHRSNNYQQYRFKSLSTSQHHNQPYGGLAMSPNNSELALNYRSTSNTAIDAAFDDGGSDTGVLNSAVGGAVTARFFLDSGSASNSNKLSPSSVASAVAAAAAATASSLSAAQMSSSSSNLLSPRTHIAKKQYLVENQTKNPASSHQNQQAMLKQMQKKYSKSVDCTHYLDATAAVSHQQALIVARAVQQHQQQLQQQQKHHVTKRSNQLLSPCANNSNNNINNESSPPQVQSVAAVKLSAIPSSSYHQQYTNLLSMPAATGGSSSRLNNTSSLTPTSTATSNYHRSDLHSPSSASGSRSNLSSSNMLLPSSTECLQKELLRQQQQQQQLAALLNLSSSSSVGGSSIINLPATTVSTQQQKVQRQHSHNSPLVPRRTDYEPVARVTIQRQQRVSEQSPTKCSNERLNQPPTCFSFSLSSNTDSTPHYRHASTATPTTLSPKTCNNNASSAAGSTATTPINRPITLDLSKAFLSTTTASSNYLRQNDSIGLSTTSTNEDDFLVIGEEIGSNRIQQQSSASSQHQQMKLGAGVSKEASLSSSSPMTSSPRLLPRQPSNASTSSSSLMPGAPSKLKSQSSADNAASS